MSWSGGSYTKGNAATGGWAGDASLGIGIEAGRHDTQDNDFATGINNCLAKDGQNAMTANINLGGYVPTNVGAGTAAAPAYCAGNDSNTGMFSAAADNIGFATNGSERVRIDSTGKVGIGTTSPTNALDVRGNISSGSQTPSGSVNLEISQYSNDSAGPTFQTIKSRGASVGTAGAVTSGDSLFVQQIYGNHGSGNARAAYIQAIVDSGTVSSTSMPGALIFATTPNGSITTSDRFKIAENGQKQFINGIITIASSAINSLTGTNALRYNTNDGVVSYDTSSRLIKENIVDSPYGLDAVLALQSRKYFRTDDQREEVGFIADEVDAVVPEVVTHGPKSCFTKNEEDTEIIPIGVNYDRLTSVLCKAIQELNAKVEALEARVAVLEA